MAEFNEKTMTPFDFVVRYRKRYMDRAAQDTSLWAIYAVSMKDFRDKLVSKDLCSSEEEQILDMMVRECRILKELAIQSGVANSK